MAGAIESGVPRPRGSPKAVDLPAWRWEDVVAEGPEEWAAAEWAWPNGTEGLRLLEAAQHLSRILKRWKYGPIFRCAIDRSKDRAWEQQYLTILRLMQAKNRAHPKWLRLPEGKRVAGKPFVLRC